MKNVNEHTEGDGRSLRYWSNFRMPSAAYKSSCVDESNEVRAVVAISTVATAKLGCWTCRAMERAISRDTQHNGNQLVNGETLSEMGTIP